SCRVIDDALVGLMRHEPIDIAGAVAGSFERVLDDIGYHCHRVLEDSTAFHPQVADRLRRRWTAIHIELGLLAPIPAQVRCQNTTVFTRTPLALRLEHDGTSAVAEKNTRTAIAPVKDAGKGLRSYHQRTLEPPCVE